jgi:hypothetical protein
MEACGPGLDAPQARRQAGPAKTQIGKMHTGKMKMMDANLLGK